MNKSLPYYYRHLNRPFLNFLPEGLGRVLEFGCSAGMLGKTYKEKNPSTIWHGVEINAEAAEHAKQNLDIVWVDNGNAFEANDVMLEKPYDAIIYGDVIEHFIDPEEALPQHIPLLRSGGELIACIPNLQHWSVMHDLLQGNFEYQQDGLLDKTHLRFFTRKSIKNLIRRLGLEMVQFSGLTLDNKLFPNRIEQRNEFIELLELLSTAGDMDFNKHDFLTFQYVFRAKRS